LTKEMGWATFWAIFNELIWSPCCCCASHKVTVRYLWRFFSSKIRRRKKNQKFWEKKWKIVRACCERDSLCFHGGFRFCSTRL
jgi:hypothetical protein